MIKSDSVFIQAVFLLTVFLCSNIYSINQQFSLEELSMEIILDLETDVEEEIDNLGDLEQDQSHTLYFASAPLHLVKSGASLHVVQFLLGIASPIFTPPPERI